MKHFTNLTAIIIFTLITLATALGADFSDLKIAIENGNFDEVKSIIEKDKSALAMKDTDGGSLLHLAAYYAGRARFESPGVREKYKNIVLYLLSKGASLASKKDNGNTPLQLAVFGGNTEIVEILLARKADVNDRNLIGNMPIHTASRVHDTRILEMLLSHGADVNSCNFRNETPLMLATVVSDPEMMDFLIGKGARVNAQNVEGNTPLHLAVFGENLEGITLLLKRGADPAIMNKMGLSASHMTTNDDVKKLLEKPEPEKP